MIIRVNHKTCVIHCQKMVGKKRALSSGEGKMWMAWWERRRTQIEFFFKRGGNSQEEDYKQQDALYPRRVSPQNSSGTGIEVENALFLA